MTFLSNISQQQHQTILEKINTLQTQNPELLQARFNSIHKSVFSKTDCLSCAKCCRNFSPIILPEEITQIANAAKISSETLFEKHVMMDEDGDFVFKTQPCPMLDLENNKCKIYENRPLACREYPHTNQVPMIDFLDLLEKNIEICPAAVEIVELV